MVNINVYVFPWTLQAALNLRQLVNNPQWLIRQRDRTHALQTVQSPSLWPLAIIPPLPQLLAQLPTWTESQIQGVLEMSKIYKFTLLERGDLTYKATCK